MMFTRRTARWVVVLIGVFFAPAPLIAFDEVLHRYLVYAIARANEFSREDAEVIANASWSLDRNDTTTAFDWALVRREVAAVVTGRQSSRRCSRRGPLRCFTA